VSDASTTQPPGAVRAPAEPTDSVGPGQITERPEAQVGAAFAGGLVLALILKRLGR
jgi:hypothetical protein